MPRVAAISLAWLAFSLFPCAVGRAQPTADFVDIDASSRPDAVRFLAAEGTLQGYPDASFRPGDPVRRADLAAVVARSRNLDPVGGGCFNDVPGDAWFAPAVCAFASRGIIDGFGDGSFRPHDPVTYAQALKVVLEAFDPPRASETEVSVSEAAAPWYRPFQLWADQRGYLGLHSYHPDEVVTRDALAGLLYAVIAPAAPSAVRSPGCGRPPPAQPPTTLEVRGEPRSLLATVPADPRSDLARPLVFAFHGRTSPNSLVRRYFRLEAWFPDAVILYPSGTRDGAGFAWSAPDDPAEALRDYELFDALLARYAEAYCIDLGRVYLVGHSLGGWFANSLACARGEQVRAVATVGGGVSPSACSGPVAAMVIHNPDDRLVPVEQGEAARDLFVSLTASRGPPAPTPEAPLAALSCARFRDATLHPVLWCPHDIDIDPSGRDYPHHWPRVTAEAIATFFATLP